MLSLFNAQNIKTMVKIAVIANSIRLKHLTKSGCVPQLLDLAKMHSLMYIVDLCSISEIMLQQQVRMLQFPSGHGTNNRSLTNTRCMIVKFYAKGFNT